MQKDTCLCFINFQKAFDRVEHNILLDCLIKRGVDNKDVSLISEIYNRQVGFMRDDEMRVHPIMVQSGVRQGCVLSPLLFNTYADVAFREIDQEETGVQVYDVRRISRISYADDTVLLAETEEALQDLMSRVEAAGKVFSIAINVQKTKTMLVSNKGQKELHINLNGTELRQVENFQYLGIWINEVVKFDTDVRVGIVRVKESFWRDKELLRNSLSLHLKKKLLKTQVWSVLLSQ